MNTLFPKLAKRIEVMTPQGTEQEVIYNFLFGALYALVQAERFDYPSQSDDPEKSTRRSIEVRQMAAAIVTTASLPEKGYEWTGGYYFNDALVRLSVCLEHLLRYRTNLRKFEKVTELIEVASHMGFKEIDFAPNWSDGKAELDAIRHRSWDYGSGPKVSYHTALDMLERLFDAVDWAFVPSSPTH